MRGAVVRGRDLSHGILLFNPYGMSKPRLRRSRYVPDRLYIFICPGPTPSFYTLLQEPSLDVAVSCAHLYGQEVALDTKFRSQVETLRDVYTSSVSFPSVHLDPPYSRLLSSKTARISRSDFHKGNQYVLSNLRGVWAGLAHVIGGNMRAYLPQR